MKNTKRIAEALRSSTLKRLVTPDKTRTAGVHLSEYLKTLAPMPGRAVGVQSVKYSSASQSWVVLVHNEKEATESIFSRGSSAKFKILSQILSVDEKDEAFRVANTFTDYLNAWPWPLKVDSNWRLSRWIFNMAEQNVRPHTFLPSVAHGVIEKKTFSIRIPFLNSTTGNVEGFDLSLSPSDKMMSTVSVPSLPTKALVTMRGVTTPVSDGDYP